MTKHWIKINKEQLKRFKKIEAVFNTSVSPLDSDEEIKYRLEQAEIIKKGIKAYEN